MFSNFISGYNRNISYHILRSTNMCKKAINYSAVIPLATICSIQRKYMKQHAYACLSSVSVSLLLSNIAALTNCISGLTSREYVDARLTRSYKLPDTNGLRWRACRVSPRESTGRSTVMHPRRIRSIYLAGSDAG